LDVIETSEPRLLEFGASEGVWEAGLPCGKIKVYVEAVGLTMCGRRPSHGAAEEPGGAPRMSMQRIVYEQEHIFWFRKTLGRFADIS
jgi:hypothetical protein